MFSLTHGTTTQTLKAWSISGAVLTRRALAADDLSFTVPLADATGNAPAFAYGDSLVLMQDGVRRFTGTITGRSIIATQGEHRLRITAHNAWWQLERIIYQQPYVKRVVDEEEEVGYVLAGGLSTRVVLGLDSWGRKISNSTQIAWIIAYAQARVGGLFFANGLTYTSGIPSLIAFGSGTEQPLGEARDISCAAAILRMVEYTPDCGAWFDYAASATPTLHLTRRSGLTSLTLDLNDRNLIAEVGSLSARDDVRPTGVLFTFITGEIDEETGEWIPEEVRQSAGAGSLSPGIIAATLSLAGEGTAEPEPVPSGLASAYYSALNYTSWEGQLTLKESECSGTVRPGLLLKLTNGPAEWATMNAMIKAVTEDLDSGTTTIELGLPGAISAQDFADLMRRWRDRKPASDFSRKKDNGTEGIPPPGDGEPGNGSDEPGFGGAPDVEEGSRGGNGGAGSPGGSPIKVCEDGGEKIIYAH